MLKVENITPLSSGRGRVGINWDGTIIVQQGLPHGVMANPGEVFLTPEDLKLINKLLRVWKKAGNKPLAPDAIRAL